MVSRHPPNWLQSRKEVSGEPGTVHDDGDLAAGGPFPLIVLAHGIGAPAKSNQWVAEHLAQHGFFVIAPSSRCRS